MHRNPNHFPKYIKEEGCDKMEEKENAVFYPFLCMTYSNNRAMLGDTTTMNPSSESISICVKCAILKREEIRH